MPTFAVSKKHEYLKNSVPVLDLTFPCQVVCVNTQLKN